MEEYYEGIDEDGTISQVEYGELPTVPDKVFSMWMYVLMFFGPCCTALVILFTQTDLDPLYSALISLAVMNGSINMVIAWLTIRLDDHSNEALVHLETIMSEMDKLEDTLDDANDMVTSFTKDLDEAKDLFKKVGVDLTELELEPISDVIQSLKDNKDDLNEILSNLREVDVTTYIKEARAIDWKALLAGINDVMAFIKSKSTGDTIPRKIGSIAVISPSFDDLPADEDVEEDYQDELDEFRLMPMPDVTNTHLSLKRKTPSLGLKRR
jgi:hypothetical protein